MPNPNAGPRTPGEGVAGAIAAASAALFIDRVAQPLDGLSDPERTQHIARIVGGRVAYLLENSPTLADKPMHNPIVIHAGAGE